MLLSSTEIFTRRTRVARVEQAAQLSELVWQVKVEGICECRVRVVCHSCFCSRLFVLDFLLPRVSSLVTGAIVAWAGLRPLWLYAMILQEGTIPHALEFQQDCCKDN